MQLTEFRVLTFDVYGTLIDWETGIHTALEPLWSRLDPVPSRDAVLEAHARHESSQQRQTPTRRYAELLATVYRRLAEEWGLGVSWAECRRYGASVGDWPAFPDSAAALAELQKHFTLAVLTNTDNESFAASNEKLGVTFDGVYTAEDVGAYKPADAGFVYMLDRLGARGVARSDILHTAESLFHDHVPAARHGLARCWIHRRHAQQGFGATMDPGERPQVEFRFTSMAGLAEAHAALIG
ncbi:MAG: haloacid dehalogenase type II [Alkalilacustris sp.]